MARTPLAGWVSSRLSPEIRCRTRRNSDYQSECPTPQMWQMGLRTAYFSNLLILKSPLATVWQQSMVARGEAYGAEALLLQHTRIHTSCVRKERPRPLVSPLNLTGRKPDWLGGGGCR